MMVRDFQRCIGVETRHQCLDQYGKLPAAVVACVGGGSNAAGIFHPFVTDSSVKLIGVEAGGLGMELTGSGEAPLIGPGAQGRHASTLSYGSPGVLHGSFSYVLQDGDGQTANVHSVSAGLDYPGVGPEHSYWKDTGRVVYRNVTDQDALDTFHLCGRLEGILPALETAHAVHEAIRVAATMSKDDIVVICFSGRGDKDCAEVARLMADPHSGH
jgi:tryptophan synthase beta chain